MTTCAHTHDPDSPRAPRDLLAAPGRGLGLKSGIATLQSFVISTVVEVLVLLVLVTLVWVVAGVAMHVWEAITTRSVDAFKTLSVELLTVFIFIEIFHSLSEYMRFHRIRVTHLVDASLAFVLREIWVGMYSGHSEWQSVLALSALVFALGGVRTLAVVYSPGGRTRTGEA